MSLSNNIVDHCCLPSIYRTYSLLLNGQVLTQVNEYKYLGIPLSLQTTCHGVLTLQMCATKLEDKAGYILYRCFYQNSNSNTLLKLYIPKLCKTSPEYSAVVWNPHLKGDIEALKKVQKYALRDCFKSWDSNYEALLSMASLPSLRERRMQASLCHLFKIINGLTDFPGAPVAKRQFQHRHLQH